MEDLSSDHSTSLAAEDSNTCESECQSSIDNFHIERRTRKRLRKPDQWKRIKRKCLRNRGKEYIDSNDALIPPRVCGKECKCSLRCFESISREDRDNILSDFNNLADFDVQNAYLHGLIQSIEPKRRYTTKGRDSKRKTTFQYYLRVHSRQRKVCLTAFCSMHGISVKRVRNVRDKETTPPLDQRGKHDNRPNRISEDCVETVKMHILSFPRQTSHYSRSSNPNKRYLSPGLSIKKMHTLYMQKCDEVGWPTVTEPTYRRTFCEEFNFAFGSPRSDTCKMCDTLNCHIKDATDLTSKQKFSEELEEHHKVAELGFKTLKNDTELAKKNSESMLVISFDLQQNLPTPHIHTGLVFYLRQLWVYNLGIHNCGSRDGYMCMWPENIASRGSDEIASCLWNFFQSLPTTRKHLVAYSDSCGGQNKNFYIVCFWVYLLLKGYFEVIDHKFLTPGHTFLPSDRDFAIIEKKKRDNEIFIPLQWFKLVEGARTNQPFRVAQMKREDFKDIKGFSKKFVNRKNTTDKKKLSFQKVAWFRYTKDDPTKILIRHSLSVDEPWKVWNIGRKQVKLDSDIPLLIKYDTHNSINKNKYDDLMKMKGFIPQAYHSYYNNLPSFSNEVDTDAEYVDSE